MKISIITVVYNDAGTIAQTIASVRSQSHRDVEHIVIDGASTDGTLEVIGRHRKCISVVVSGKDNGIYDAMNKGIGRATGDVIGFLNANDVFSDDLALERVAAAFFDSSADACYGDLVYVDASDLGRVVRYWKSCRYKDGLFEKGWCPAHPTFFVRKRIYDRHGGFDLAYELGNDTELMMRLLVKHRIKSVYIPEVLVKMRVGGVSNRSLVNIIRQNMEILQAGKKNNVEVSVIRFIAYKFGSRIWQRLARPAIAGR